MNKFLVAVPVVIAAAAGGIYFMANNEAEVQIDRLIGQALASGNYQQIIYEDINIGVDGTATLTNLHIIDIEENDYIIQQVIISDYDYLNEIPEYMSVQVNGIKFPSGLPQPNDALAGAPEFNDYLSNIMTDDAIPVMMKYQYTYDPEDNDLIESDISIGLLDAGNISFKSSIKNIPLANFYESSTLSPEEAQQQLMSYVAVAEIPQLSIELDDGGILDSILEVRAEQLGMTSEAARQRMIAQVNSLPLFAPPSVQIQAQQISSQLANFLEGNKIFSLSLTPEHGGNIQQLQPEIMAAMFSGDYGKILTLLDLKVNSQ